jgi:hypothetical protein
VEPHIFRRGCRIQADADGHQPEADRPGPHGSRHRASVDPSPNSGRRGPAGRIGLAAAQAFRRAVGGYMTEMLAGFISTTLLIIVVIIAVIIGTIVWALRKIF